MRRWPAQIVGLTAAFTCLAVTCLSAPAAHAAAPGLQVNPLEYQSLITGTDVRNGYVDVANPGDTTINVAATVQGFRQADLAGDLAFFPDAKVESAIVLGISQFTLGPRQAIRVTFSVDPTQLPKGGTYAVIFFRTIPPGQSSSTSFIAESANVGTLLLLQNGPAQDIGRIKQLSLGFWQFGTGLTGSGQYQNTNNTAAPIAFKPKLSSRIWPWGHTTKFVGPLVLPGSTREFILNRPGSYLGLVPVSLTDATSGQTVTRWVVAVTGFYAFVLLFIIVLLGLVFGYRLQRGHTLIPHNLGRTMRKYWHRFRGRKPPVRRPSFDGLSARPVEANVTSEPPAEPESEPESTNESDEPPAAVPPKNEAGE